VKETIFGDSSVALVMLIVEYSKIKPQCDALDVMDRYTSDDFVATMTLEYLNILP